MHIKIILPSFYDEHGNLVKTKKVFVPCITIRYLAAMVPHHHRVSVVEESVEDLDYDEKWIWSELPFKLLVRKELMMLPPSIRNGGCRL